MALLWTTLYLLALTLLNWRKKLKIKLGFYFSFNVRKKLVTTTFLPVLDYGVSVRTIISSIHLYLDAVYHGALRFISDRKPSTHHCVLYNRVGWPSLLTRRKMHWYLIIYTLISLLSYQTESCWEILPSLTKLLYSLWSELGKKAFMYAAPSDWNHLQSNLKLQSLTLFKRVIRQMEIDSMTCNCF